MRVNTHIGNTIDAIDFAKARYDKNVKEVLSDVKILARIVKYTVTEVKELSIDEIIKCIDTERIEADSIPVEPGLTNYGKSKEAGRKMQFEMKALLYLILNFH